jgi:mRNA-degrading endonuclease toxin of MazEF toxin-antitoxin module
MKRGEVWWVNFEPAVGGEVASRSEAEAPSRDTPMIKMIKKALPSRVVVASLTAPLL